MKNRRNFIFVCLCIFLLTSCVDQQDHAGLILYKSTDPFIYNFARQIETYADGTLELEVFDSKNSQILQNEQILEAQLGEVTDLMIINPVDRLSSYAIINKQRELEIPVIFFNREPLQKDLALWEDAYYVGAKAEQSGQLQAELIMELFGSNPYELNEHDRNGDGVIQALILKGEPGHQDAEIRSEEVVKVFNKQGYTIDTLVEVANWERGQAYENMDDILQDYGNQIEVILSNNDAMAIGAIQRMRESGFFTDTNGNGQIDPSDENWIPVVGIDGIAEAVGLIKEGFLYGTVINDSDVQAQAIIELSEFILGKRSSADFSFELVADSYIWVDYKVFTLE